MDKEEVCEANTMQWYKAAAAAEVEVAPPDPAVLPRSAPLRVSVDLDRLNAVLAGFGIELEVQ